MFPQEQFFANWLLWIVRFPKLVLLMVSIATLASVMFTVSYLNINTDTEDMLSSDLPFRKNSIALGKAFPQFSDNIVIVVDAPTTDQTQDAAGLLFEHLKKYPELFGEIFDPEGSQFVRNNGLLYLGVEELEEHIEKLSAAQPFLSRLNANPTLPELFRLIDQIVENETNTGDQTSIKLASSTLNSIALVMESQLTTTPRPLSWRSLISGKYTSSDDQHRVIVTRPKTNFSSLQPGKEAIEKIRRLTSELKLMDRFGARVRLTGSLALSQEELQSVIDGLGLAAIISVVLVIGLLFLCLRSITLLIASLITLGFGLLLTAGFATASVGTLNLISVTFSVLFIGLSVDFSIHYCLRYKENQNYSGSHHQALVAAAKSCGPALMLAAIAAAIGFFSFIPTDYIGLAELGLIAGSGMLIALLTNFTLLPTLILLFPKPRKEKFKISKSSNPIFNSTRNFRILILMVAIAALIVSIISVHKVSFDFDPMKLRDPKTESVSTMLELMTESQSSPYSITVLKDNLEEANELSKTLSSLRIVDDVITLSSLIPENQGDKLEMIENLSLILLPSLNITTSAVSPPLTEVKKAFTGLKQKLSKTFDKQLNKDLAASADRLNSVMSRYEAETKLSKPAINQLERLLLGSFHQRIVDLRRSLEAEDISYSNIPTQLKERWESQDGKTRIQVTPTGNMLSRKILSTFVKEVQQIAPQATGSPVSIFEAGNTVIRSFIQAGATTIVLIGVLVLFLTRRLREIILILAPLLIAALITASISVIFSLQFNFANVIVLPLLFGLGIAGNIHMVIRERRLSQISEIINTTTPRAVLFSALTTIGSFGSIALSSHPGTSSMGVLLTIAIISTLICTLIFLPIFMVLWPDGSKQGAIRGK